LNDTVTHIGQVGAALFADLHCHTQFSDGSLSPAEVVSLAIERGLRVLAITDHDSIGGWFEASRTAAQARAAVGFPSLKIIPGVEINTAWLGGEIHVLGYFDPRVLELHESGGTSAEARRIAALDHSLNVLRHKRVERAHAIVDKLRGLGVDIVWEHVEGLVSGPSVGRSHIARALVERGAASSAREAFGLYLNAGAAAYVPNYNIQPVDAIRLIRDSGGVPVLAHPKSTDPEVLCDWVDAGLAGLEVWHPDHSATQTDTLLKWTERAGVLATGGSDFHGFGLHAELGAFGVDEERAQRLIGKLATAVIPAL